MSHRPDLSKNTKKHRSTKKNQPKASLWEWEKRMVEVQRVSKVVKGGKKLSFRVTAIVGNKNSQVGVGLGKADEVSTAMKKAVNDAKKNIIRIPLNKNKTLPHTIYGVDGASKVFLRPAGTGTGVIAGSSIRMVLELGGVQNILTKQLGRNNLLNNARATILALKSLKTAQQRAKEREIPLEKIYHYKN